MDQAESSWFMFIDFSRLISKFCANGMQSEELLCDFFPFSFIFIFCVCAHCYYRKMWQMDLMR